MTQHINTDILIIGGGIAGLWLNAHLKKKGFSTLLLETETLGGQQTLHSQGIIHGGAKYTLHGTLSGASEAIADMPARWRQAINGEDDVDLRDVRILSEAHYLWSPGSLASNLTNFFASKAVRARIRKASFEQLPESLQHNDFKGNAYQLDELVLDIPSVVKQLTKLAGDSIIKTQTIEPQIVDGHLISIQTDQCCIKAQRTVLTAGKGNAELLRKLNINQPKQQLRPLQMVMLKGSNLTPLYAHCLGLSPKPRMTITSHPCSDGQWVWYIGGDLAENGINRTQEEQIRCAQKELSSVLPWINTTNAQWDTLYIERSEPKQEGFSRPDSAFLAEHESILIGWPTKLALAPNFSDQVLHNLETNHIKPENDYSERSFDQPNIGKPIWETVFK